ncbi:hypothetical protein [Aeromonas dhakensis]|uniref:hypothetical protein n=1 Tax=Aeromonas dhakensis TaxID=196024 RepID=UPI001B3A0BBD|nr:hypothetical protein [Aeromonas dhakensis]MBQ4672899.1 hypothetical protein [Aeromonas dhakensis]
MTDISYDIIDGVPTPQTIIDSDFELHGVHQGSVTVKSGKFRLLGVLQGSLRIQSEDEALITGEQQGSVHISEKCRVAVTGKIKGSTHIAYGATLVIKPDGTLAGSLHNNGTVIIEGVFGGAQSGIGEVVVRGNGYIKQPRVENGIHYYEW